MLKYLFLTLSVLAVASLGHSTTAPDFSDPTVTICVEISSPTAAPATGLKKSYVRIPYNFTVSSWALTADQSGSASVGVVMDSLANFPPVAGDNISVTSMSATSVLWSSGTTTAWSTTSLPQGSYLDFNLASITSWTRFQVCLMGSRN